MDLPCNARAIFTDFPLWTENALGTRLDRVYFNRFMIGKLWALLISTKYVIFTQ